MMDIKKLLFKRKKTKLPLEVTIINAADPLLQEIKLIRTLKDLLYDTIVSQNKGTPMLLDARKKLKHFLGLRKIYKSIGIEPYKGRGAVAEVMLRFLCEEWLKTYNITGYYIDGLLFRVDRISSQLDGLLVTDRFIACIECKSYYGKLKIDGTKLTIPTKDTYPWQQNLKHIDFLKESCQFLEPYPIRNIVYLFSNGYIELEDFEPSPLSPVMVNSFAFTLLNNIYNKSTIRFRTSNLNFLKDRLAEYIPSVSDEKSHIEMLSIINGTSQDDYLETVENDN